MEHFCFFKLDEFGHVIGIYIDVPRHIEIGIFPKQICYLKFLEELRLSNCSISKIPKEIELLTSLKVLDLHNNEITEIPKSINNPENLKYLNLEGNCKLKL